ncbi:MAG: leucine--tRNA ligase [Candidatus Ryanbacteria bacterium]|nr:leucine--tRNA ligase [Candidatus Ryanbacteria bacterium]
MKKYNPQALEKKWQSLWLKDRIYEPNLDNAKKPFYNLMMFPYPSAEGLHVGNMYAFVGADICGRKKRMEGFDVFEPIGLDGFGIHSENYAIKIGKHPKQHAADSEKNFYRQLASVGNGFAWEQKLETYDPEYYRWTQWLFIQLFKAGLAYRKKAEVNWCPHCLTVLANEQVIAGECERCRTIVAKKQLEQWFFKITDYADKLLAGLDTIDWTEKIKIAQRNWIGKSEGAEIDFVLTGIRGQENGKHALKIFTTRPDTIFGATFCVISPELAQSWLDVGWQTSDDVRAYIKDALRCRAGADRRAEEKEKTGIFSGINAVNPATDKEIPVWVSDYVLAGYGTGAIMAVPAHDERDREFAQKFNLPVSDAPLIEFDEAIKKAGGKRTTNYRLRDWLVSRQRYWGAPIPMIWCDSCTKWMPEREENLPVLLPDVKEFRPTGTDKSPLANFPEFYQTTCPECGGAARRETDVCDTFLDSSWYYLRYLDPKNNKEPFSQDRARRWLPVASYIGGAEHSVLHLLYVRFISIALHDLKLADFAKNTGGEPMPRFRAHGLIIKDGAKMSKSRGNVVNPDEYLAVYGADVLRMYLMFLGPFDQGGDFRDDGIKGITRFLFRTWDYYVNEKRDASISNEVTGRLAHKTIKKVTRDMEELQNNTAISALMVLLTQMEREPDAFADSVFLLMLAPFAPFITEEIFAQRGSRETIHKGPWPQYDPAKTIDDTFQLVIQINGKVRDIVSVATDITEADARTLALAREKIKMALAGSEPKKTIFVPKKLINLVQ